MEAYLVSWLNLIVTFIQMSPPLAILKQKLPIKKMLKIIKFESFINFNFVILNLNEDIR